MTKIYLEMTGHTHVTRDGDPDDRWDGDDTSTDWSFGEVSLSHDNSYWRESFETNFDVKPGDPIVLVVAVWSTGDSFHRADGEYAEVFGAFKTREEATAYAAKLRGNEDIDVYRPWLGYFESLDEVEVLGRVVNP